MSVDIISIGKLKYSYVRCHSCESVLRYLLADEKITTSLNSPYGLSTDYSIVCPCCKAVIITRAISESASFDNRIPEEKALKMGSED